MPIPASVLNKKPDPQPNDLDEGHQSRNPQHEISGGTDAGEVNSTQQQQQQLSALPPPPKQHPQHQQKQSIPVTPLRNNPFEREEYQPNNITFLIDQIPQNPDEDNNRANEDTCRAERWAQEPQVVTVYRAEYNNIPKSAGNRHRPRPLQPKPETGLCTCLWISFAIYVYEIIGHLHLLGPLFHPSSREISCCYSMAPYSLVYLQLSSAPYIVASNLEWPPVGWFLNPGPFSSSSSEDQCSSNRAISRFAAISAFSASSELTRGCRKGETVCRTAVFCSKPFEFLWSRVLWFCCDSLSCPML